MLTLPGGGTCKRDSPLLGRHKKSAIGLFVSSEECMTKLFKILAISALLVGPASTAHAQISFGIHIGEPPAPRAYRVPPRPGPDYVWVEGYQYPEGGRYRWHDGYWTRPP